MSVASAIQFWFFVLFFFLFGFSLATTSWDLLQGRSDFAIGKDRTADDLPLRVRLGLGGGLAVVGLALALGSVAAVTDRYAGTGVHVTVWGFLGDHIRWIGAALAAGAATVALAAAARRVLQLRAAGRALLVLPPAWEVAGVLPAHRAPVRRGLVLEGGGAKGAYAFGCLQALDDAGIRFDAVAGTSVGALNACLLASGQLDQGAEYWGDLRPGKVIRLRFVQLLLLPLFLLRFVAYLMGSRMMHPYSAMRLNGRMALRFSLWATAVWVVAAVTSWGFFSDLAAYYLLGAAVALVAALVVWVPWWLDRGGHSLLSPRPLARTVEQIVDTVDPEIPVYVTVSYEQSVETTGDIPYGEDHVVRDFTYDKTERMVRYYRIDEMTRADRHRFVLASAALPEGVFPPIGGPDEQLLRDGGVVDNLPIWPLVSLAGCKELYVIHLRPSDDAAAGPGLDSYREYWEAIGKRTMTSREHPGFADRIVSIAPPVSLGGFLSGTLRFSGPSARRWVSAGRRHMSMALAEMAQPRAPSRRTP